MHFDLTFTIGNLIETVAFAIAAVAFSFRLDAKVNNHEKWIKDHEECNQKQISILNELRGELKYLRGLFDAKRPVPLKDQY